MLEETVQLITEVKYLTPYFLDKADVFRFMRNYEIF